MAISEMAVTIIEICYGETGDIGDIATFANIAM